MRIIANHRSFLGSAQQELSGEGPGVPDVERGLSVVVAMKKRASPILSSLNVTMASFFGVSCSWNLSSLLLP